MSIASMVDFACLPNIDSIVDFYKVPIGSRIELKLSSSIKGDVAQMEERSLCMREVQGSIPCISNDIYYFKVLIRPYYD